MIVIAGNSLQLSSFSKLSRLSKNWVKSNARKKIKSAFLLLAAAQHDSAHKKLSLQTMNGWSAFFFLAGGFFFFSSPSWSRFDETVSAEIYR
jgi:hypothetical protein